MIRLEHHRDAPPAGWDDIVQRLGGSVFHSPAWADYQQRVEGARPLFLLARDEAGIPCAAALALLRASTRPLASLVLRDLTLPAHPVVRDGDGALAAAFLDGCQTLAGALGCRHLTLGSFASGASPLVPGEHGFSELPRVEFSVDLRGDADTLWKAIRKDQRERVRRLPREGITLEVGATLDDVRGLGAARRATQEKRSRQGQGYDLDADEQFYEALYAHLMSRAAGRLFVARRDGETVAALFFATGYGRAYSMFSGSTEAGYKLGAQSGLYWSAVETFKAEGFVELNRGGVAAAFAEESHPLHGIYQFKLRLGTTPRACRSGLKVVSPVRDALVRYARRARALVASR